MNTVIPNKPVAPDTDTERRWEHSALRRRMLLGQWHDDLIREIGNHIPVDRQATWGVPDMSSNIFKATTSALCALYLEPPDVSVGVEYDGQADGLLSRNGLVSSAGYWALMQRIQFYTIGIRECFVRIDVNPTGDGLVYRIVTPDLIFADSPAGDPSKPDVIHEYRVRFCEICNEYEWTVDVLDITDINNPIYEILKVDMNGQIGPNVSEQYIGQSMSGDSYPYRDSNGRPFLPYSLYHAEITGDLFDAFHNSEIIAGTLNSSVLRSFYLHLSKNCSFPQRYMMGAVPAGMSMFDNDIASRRNAISTDPSSVLLFNPDPDLIAGQQPQIGQFQAGGDVEKMLESITTYERGIASSAGINPADVQKMSGDPRSGYAIAVSRSSLRETQRKFSPAFRRGDVETLEISAKIANRFIGGDYPETGYRIEYHAVELSPEESKSQREHILSLLSAGLISKIDAIQILHPDLDEQDARAKLIRIQQQNIF